MCADAIDNQVSNLFRKCTDVFKGLGYITNTVNCIEVHPDSITHHIESQT